jgi:hypothetical protein
MNGTLVTLERGPDACVNIGGFRISDAHFLSIALYLLKSGDIEEGDVRREFFDRVRRLKEVEGSTPGSTRFIESPVQPEIRLVHAA